MKEVVQSEAGLEVVPGQTFNGGAQNEKIPISGKNTLFTDNIFVDSRSKDGLHEPPESDFQATPRAWYQHHQQHDNYPHSPKDRRTCGLRRKTFWILVAFIIFIIVVAIAGGVGGSYAAQKKKTQNAQAKTSPSPESTSSASAGPVTSATPPASTTTGTAVSTTILLTTPTQTYLSDCPASNGTLYKVNSGGNVLNYRVLCGAAIFNSNNPAAAVADNTPSLRDCVQECAINVPDGEPCNAVCWRQRTTVVDNVSLGSCFGYTTVNTTENTFQGNLRNQYCDGAVYIGEGEGWS